MKTSQKRLPYQVLTLFTLTVISIVTVLGISWFRERQKAIPLQPAPVAERLTRAADKDQEPVVAEPARYKIHVVKSGDTVSGIAEMYQIDADTVYSANQEITDIILPGQQLIILPERGVLHMVSEGDTVWSLAATYGVESKRITNANQLSADMIIIGQQLFVPGGKLDRSTVLPSRTGTVRFLWPVAGELTSGFGYRWNRLHTGIDVAVENGTPVAAASAGYIAYAGWQGGYGRTVLLEHANGYSTLYAHLSDYIVSVHDFVPAGALIGFTGNTGVSTGPHLHFEILHYGTPLNPLKLLP